MAGSGQNTKSRNENTPGRKLFATRTRWWLRCGMPGSARCIHPDQAVIPSSTESTSRSSPTMISIMRQTNPKHEEEGKEVSTILHQKDTTIEGAGAGEPVCSKLIRWNEPEQGSLIHHPPVTDSFLFPFLYLLRPL